MKTRRPQGQATGAARLGAFCPRALDKHSLHITPAQAPDTGPEGPPEAQRQAVWAPPAEALGAVTTPSYRALLCASLAEAMSLTERSMVVVPRCKIS